MTLNPKKLTLQAEYCYLLVTLVGATWGKRPQTLRHGSMAVLFPFHYNCHYQTNLMLQELFEFP